MAEPTTADAPRSAEPGEEEVFLRVYDLSHGLAAVLSKSLLGVHIDGVWHTSIELFGEEFFFQSGLARLPAGTTPYGSHVDRRRLGVTTCTCAALDEFFTLSRETWTPAAYDLFENNCNHFSDQLAHFLLGTGIPAHILELPAQVKAAPNFSRLMGGFGSSAGSVSTGSTGSIANGTATDRSSRSQAPETSEETKVSTHGPTGDASQNEAAEGTRRE